MTTPGSTPDVAPAGHPNRVEIEAERQGWYEVVSLVRSLTSDECLVPGYYRHPDWTVRDVVAHQGTWLAEAQVQFERIGAGTRGPRRRPTSLRWARNRTRTFELDLVADAQPSDAVARVATLREPRTTIGCVNLVSGFRPELWAVASPDAAPPADGWQITTRRPTRRPARTRAGRR